MRTALLRAAGKELRASRALVLLSVAGVALGVASVLSIQILNRGALGAFEGGVRAVSGEADLSILGWTGRLPEDLLPEVLGTPGVGAAVPLQRVEVAVEGRPGPFDLAGGPAAPQAPGRSGRGASASPSTLTLEVVGADLLAPLRLPWTLPRGGVAAALGEPGWVAVSPGIAAEAGWRVGDAVAVSSGSRRVVLRIGALVDFQRIAPLASRRLAVMDLAQVQALLGTPGVLHQIDVLAADPGGAAALADRLQARLGERARVTTPAQRTVEAEGLLSAFRLNLTALSLVSLLVGGFLVYAATQAALARRREELGLLRCVGATRGQVLGLVLAEVGALGALGTAAGIPLGWLAARANAGAVSGTLRSLYLLEGIERVELTPGLVALAVAVGVGGAVVAGVAPALDAARRDPLALLSSVTQQEAAEAGAGWLLAAGGALLAGAAVVSAASARWPPSGFVLAAGIVAAAPLAAPAALRVLARVPVPRRLGVRWGLRTLGARLPSAAVAAGAVAVAVAMLAGITIMVASFRTTVVRWLGATLRADVYVTTPSWRRGRSEATLSPRVLDALGRAPGVVATDLLRQLAGYAGARRVSIAGVEAGLPAAEGRVALASGDPHTALRLLREGAVLISEPLARKAGLAPGGSLSLRTADGERGFPIAGVYYDYGAEQGAVLMDLRTFAGAFGPGPPTNAALYLAPGVDPEAVAAWVRAALPGDAVLVRSNRTLRAEVLDVFEQTFAVTRLLQAMGLVIAVAGIALSLLVQARERAGELALYRALGATRGQLFRVFLGRGVGLAGFGLAVGWPAGAGLALVLVRAVNPAFFGWSLRLDWPLATLAGQGAAVLLAAALASVHPGVRASRTPAAELSRDAI